VEPDAPQRHATASPDTARDIPGTQPITTSPSALGRIEVNARKKIAALALAAATVASGTVVAAAPASANTQAITTCGSNWPHHRWGGASTSWGETEFKICWDNKGNARIDYDASWVKDRKNDGKAVRIYLHSPEVFKLLATANPSSGKVHYTYSRGKTSHWNIDMCNGTKERYSPHPTCKLDL
jgi:hypothetical protein